MIRLEADGFYDTGKFIDYNQWLMLAECAQVWPFSYVTIQNALFLAKIEAIRAATLLKNHSAAMPLNGYFFIKTIVLCH